MVHAKCATLDAQGDYRGILRNRWLCDHGSWSDVGIFTMDALWIDWLDDAWCRRNWRTINRLLAYGCFNVLLAGRQPARVKADGISRAVPDSRGLCLVRQLTGRRRSITCNCFRGTSIRLRMCQVRRNSKKRRRIRRSNRPQWLAPARKPPCLPTKIARIYRAKSLHCEICKAY